MEGGLARRGHRLSICSSDLWGVLKDLLEALLEAIDVVVYQVLPMDLALVDEADKGEALVNFAQVQHDVLLIVRVGQPDD